MRVALRRIAQQVFDRIGHRRVLVRCLLIPPAGLALLAVATAHWPRKTTLTWLMVLFIIAAAGLAIGAAGAANAALFAVAMLATGDEALLEKLTAFRTRQTEAARAMTWRSPEPPRLSPLASASNMNPVVPIPAVKPDAM